MTCQPMTPRRVVINLRWAGRMLAWSALIGTTVLLTLLLQSLAASALVAVEPDLILERRDQ
jgi:hypothetical protein